MGSSVSSLHSWFDMMFVFVWYCVDYDYLVVLWCSLAWLVISSLHNNTACLKLDCGSIGNNYIVMTMSAVVVIGWYCIVLSGWFCLNCCAQCNHACICLFSCNHNAHSSSY